MKRLIAVLVVCAPMLALAGGKACKFSDTEKMKHHFESHVTFPTTGKDVKETCKKEMPDEFTKEERTCFEGKIKDATKFKDASELMKALGV